MGIHEEKDNIITIEDEDGNEMELEILDIIDFEGDEYLVLISTDEEAEEVYILALGEDENGEEAYFSVEDDEVQEAVFEIFKSRFSDEYNF